MNMSRFFSPRNANTPPISSRNVMICLSASLQLQGLSPQANISPHIPGIPWDHLCVRWSGKKLHLAGRPRGSQVSRQVWEQHGQGRARLGICGEADFSPFSSAWEAGGLKDESQGVNAVLLQQWVTQVCLLAHFILSLFLALSD